MPDISLFIGYSAIESIVVHIGTLRFLLRALVYCYVILHYVITERGDLIRASTQGFRGDG